MPQRVVRQSAVYGKSAVAAPHMFAAQTGQRILAEGGNAIEAMVAMAATIAVVYPHMNSIGGDGFWLVRGPDGQTTAIDACGPAGRLATIDLLRASGHSSIPPHGPLAAITVPGAVAGWQSALKISHELGGRLPLASLLEDATIHARDGYPVSASEAEEMLKEPALLKTAPGLVETYFPDGERPRLGHRRREARLAGTLERLARAGLDDFYRGDVAQAIAADCADIGAPVCREDLAAYRAVRRQPLMLRLGCVTLYNSQPPTQGLASLVLLGLFDRLGVSEGESFEHIHALVEASKRALQLADNVVTDFDHLRHDPSAFLSTPWLDAEAANISFASANPFPTVGAEGDTVWMGAIDQDGLAVSYIQSIYWEYGSGCVLPRTGILMQNRGATFSLDPAARNPLAPGRRPFHTLNPPLAVFDDGRVCAYGCMGGAGQPQFQAQIFTRWAMFGMTPAEAVDAPRFLLGRTWGAPSSTLKLESRFDEDVVRRLIAVGQIVERRPFAYHSGFGHAGMVVRHPDGHLDAVHDPRSDGGGAGC